MERIRKKVYDLLEPQEGDVGIERAINASLMALIILNVIAVVIETMPEVGAVYAAQFAAFELFSVIIFTAELVGRLWSCPADPRFAGPGRRLRFLRTPLVLIDILAIAPFYLPWIFPLDGRMVRVFRIVRLLRLFKLARYMEALRAVQVVIRSKKEQLFITAMMGFMLLLLASSLMYVIENAAQPELFSSIPSAMWWGVVTLTTVGYGDTFPITPLGRFLGACIQILGVGLFALPAGIIAGGFAEHLEKSADPKMCPHCGKPLA